MIQELDSTREIEKYSAALLDGKNDLDALSAATRDSCSMECVWFWKWCLETKVFVHCLCTLVVAIWSGWNAPADILQSWTEHHLTWRLHKRSTNSYGSVISRTGIRRPWWLGTCTASNAFASAWRCEQIHILEAVFDAACECLSLANAYKHRLMYRFSLDRSISYQQIPFNWPHWTFESSQSQSTLLLWTAPLLSMIACALLHARSCGCHPSAVYIKSELRALWRCPFTPGSIWESPNW